MNASQPVEGTLESDLANKLTAEGIELKIIELQELFKKLNNEGLVASWSEVLVDALKAIRVGRLTQDSISARLEKTRISHHKKVCEILESLHRGYRNCLVNT